MPENAKKPQIRFKGFTDAWEQRKLWEIAETYSGGTPSVSIKKYYIGDIPFIRSAEINSKSTELAINEEAILCSSAKRVSVGNILYALYGATSGEVGLSALNGAINQAVLAILPQKNYESEYLVQWLRKSKIKIINTYLQGGQGNLSAEIVKNLNINFPIHKEQIIIGKFFRNLDNLITLHQRKLDKLKNVKKSMLEKMFPKNGSNVPEIRFKGFTDAWEQRKAKEMFVSTADKGYTDLPVLSATQDRGMIRRDENSINIFHDKKNEAGYKRVLPGQFVIHLRSFQGGFAHSVIEGITSPAYTVFGFADSEKHNSEYWKYVFTSKTFIRRLETVTYGIRDGRSISYDEFLTLSFMYPSNNEQTIISQYLDNLDNLITLHQRKLEKLQNIKKACLEKMFV